MSTKQFRTSSYAHEFVPPFQLGNPLKEYSCVFSFRDMIKSFLLLACMCGCVWAILTQPASFDKVTSALTLIYFILWEGIKKITYAPKMSIWQTGRMRRWATLPLDRVPNVAVLKALIAFRTRHAL